jgi:hypothetical protein
VVNWRQKVNLLIILLYALLIYIPWSMPIKVFGISLMAWLILGLFFVAPVTSLLLIYSEKEKTH